MRSSHLLQQRIDDFDHFVRDGDHPCAMARAVLSTREARFGLYPALGTEAAAMRLCQDLYGALDQHRSAEAPLWSYVAFFEGEAPSDEGVFEDRLWRQLQAMHEFDARRHAWDRSVSADPDSPEFSFSIGGQAWYVIGLHPGASRLARRFGSTALVFNPHRQFEALRGAGKYDLVRDRVRKRDFAFQGSLNPMLADHGDSSEARQYSGRAVGAEWRCPFQRAGA
jgi:FPC/CPF motif-containing protein YcgG